MIQTAIAPPNWENQHQYWFFPLHTRGSIRVTARKKNNKPRGPVGGVWDKANKIAAKMSRMTERRSTPTCARAVMQWLTDNEIEGKVIELKTRYHNEDYIISDRVGSDESITINGKHYGVEVRGWKLMLGIS